MMTVCPIVGTGDRVTLPTADVIYRTGLGFTAPALAARGFRIRFFIFLFFYLFIWFSFCKWNGRANFGGRPTTPRERAHNVPTSVESSVRVVLRTFGLRVRRIVRDYSGKIGAYISFTITCCLMFAPRFWTRARFRFRWKQCFPNGVLVERGKMHCLFKNDQNQTKKQLILFSFLPRTVFRSKRILRCSYTQTYFDCSERFCSNSTSHNISWCFLRNVYLI